MDAPQDELWRAMPGVEFRDDGKDRTLFGHFCVFNRWTKIDSWVEGRFMERVAPGAAKKTINDNINRIRCLYDHGHDPYIGNKPLGPFRELREDATGVFYDVPLLDTDYNRDFIIPAAASKPPVLGSSFRFRVVHDDWNDEPERSEQNPEGIPERTIREFALFEGGPVTFPAYPDGTTPGLRSMTDHYIERSLNLTELLEDEEALTRAVERFPRLRTLLTPAGTATGARGAAQQDTDEPPPEGTPRFHSPYERGEVVRSIHLEGILL